MIVSPSADGFLTSLQPSDEQTSFGPLISSGQRDKVLNYIETGKEQGARIVTGGVKWDDNKDGYWIKPTVLADVHADMTVVREEVSLFRSGGTHGSSDRLSQIFGPVVVVASFKDEEEALKLASHPSYGLAAAVHTSDTKQALRVSNALDAGTVWINQYGALHCGVPFGGFKMSGIGRELGTYGLEAYTQVRRYGLFRNATLKMRDADTF